VGVSILWSGSRIIGRSLNSLLDAAVPEATQATIREVIAAEGAGAVEAHDLRTRRAGQMDFIEFHLTVPGEMTVETAHAICDRIEAALRTRLGSARITIHLEPAHKGKGHLPIAPA